MREPLEGRVAVVIGSATGIGAATAAKLAERGARVLLADLALDAAQSRAREIIERGGQAFALQCDVVDESAVAGVIAAAVDRWGGLDILHNNAAAMQLVRGDGAVADATAEHWDETFAVNVRGQMFGCKHAIPAMLARGGGSIINTSSASGLLGDLGLSAYGAGKAAINQLTRAVAVQYGRQNIRCNAVIPGLIKVERPEGRGMTVEQRLSLREHQPAPFDGVPDDVASAVAFLAGDDARFVNGHLLVVDGGLTAHMPTYGDAMRS
ncbi:MAG: 7-alpha-hydroxysteroid dehydrogenase [Rhodoglobus sp.]|nr:7-alpha-hydroxysteroid dehydrogenase [Rhodoglobus sp.]